MRLAIIDDEVTVCRRLATFLETEGFEVETFRAASPFWARMQQHAFDVAFIDLNLPDTNGMQILSRLRADYEDSEAIIITGHSSYSLPSD